MIFFCADFGSGGELTLEEIIKIAIGVAQGMEHMHNLRIAHCDLKPDNIMLTQDDEVKLIDFGAATKFNKEGDIGTPGYFLEGKKETKEKACAERDIYSYGTILLQLLRGDADVITQKGKSVSYQEHALSVDDNKLARPGLLLTEGNKTEDKKTKREKKVMNLVQLTKRCINKDLRSRPKDYSRCSSGNGVGLWRPAKSV
ncbi:uncharacterized protein LOC141591388 [Silene latifolia]|uniref:uncharacterized protein LOC141591388 n=1 Tax=Silene latifolia TaxID=37657 RepID=UPI003D780437